jgi:diguanylate cyclase (GGDEF)-like protein/PAS domain S-box-containing protein
MSDIPLDTRTPGGPAAAQEGIPERRRQEKLLKTGALQNAIFNSANFSSIATDEKGVIQLFNVGAEHMLGYAAVEVVNKFTPADISDPQELISRAIALELEFATPITAGFEALVFKASRGIEDIYELTYTRKDGSRFPAIVSVTALRSEQGTIIGYLLIGTDNTARKQDEVALLKAGAELERLRAEEALRVSEERYRSLFESIDDGFCIIEKVENNAGEPLDFRYIEANPAFVLYSGVSNVVGKTIRQVMPNEPKEWFLTYDSVLRTGEPIRFEHQLLTQWCVLELHAFRIDDPTHCRVGVSFKDITSRKQAEESLRESEAFNRSIIKSSPDCIKVLDLEGNLLSMQSGQELLGIEDIRPFLNTSWIAFWEGEHRQAAQAAIKSAAAGAAGKFVGFFRTFRGETKWWDVAVSPILDANGKPARLLAVSRDVTQRRRAEMNLEFLASVSQDLAHWTNMHEMMQTVGAKMAAYLQLSQCALAEINDTAEQVVINYDWHRKDVPSLVGVFRLADFVGEEFIRVARAGEVIVVRNTALDPRTDPEKFATLKIASFVCVPLIQEGEWRFALCLYHSVAYDWREDEIELLRELTARIWTRLERLRAEVALHASEQKYRTLFESIDEGFCIIQKVGSEAGEPLDFRYVEANPGFAAQSGVSDVVGKTIRQVFPDEAEEWVLTYDTVLRTGEPIRFERGLIAQKRVLELYAFRVVDETHHGIAVIFKDITERKKAEERLHESVRELRAAEFELRSTEVALSKEKATLDDHVLQLLQANQNLTVATNEAHTLAEEIDQARIRMVYLAQHDPLTDLPNRILLNDRLAQAIALARRQGKQLAVMFLDLDRFKHINDSLGHAVGDQLLQSVAKRLMAVVRSSDTVCRQGGDEFVILLADVEHAEDAALSAQKILAALTVPHCIDQLELHVTVSIGISIYPEDGQDADTLIKSADTAMYHAKESGRNNYQFFEQTMNVLAVERHSIEGGLRRALERQEFMLLYQPKIDLETGTISGVEALLRWQHPQRGLILPEQFVGIAEDCGLIVPIGAWVLREACRQAQTWQDSGLPSVPVAVNISAVQFRHKDFLASLTGILKDTGLAPRYLELELTESVLMQDADSTACVLKALKAMGVRLAIDDFGTGYSSLSYLKRFPIDTLKIDQSFLRDIIHATSDSDDAAIVAAVVSMGKNLKQRVIAEGVETREQLAFLQAQGCGEGQGFYFSRPVTADALGKLLQTGLTANFLGKNFFLI